MKSNCVKIAWVLIAYITALLYGVAGNDADDDCGGIHPDNFKSIILSGGKIKSLNVLDDPLCYCRKPYMNETCAFQCHPCDDNPDRCESFGNCCSYRKIGNATAMALRRPTDPASTLFEPNVTCFNGAYLVLKSCPVGFKDNHMRKLCEEGLPDNETTMATVTMVTDEVNNASYFNRYCAECNNVSRIREWIVSVRCDTYFYVRDALSELELIRLSLNTTLSTCEIFQRPGGLEPLKCDKRFFKESTAISKCSDRNEFFYTNRLRKACENGADDPKLRVEVAEVVYKNIYCIMCNKAVCNGGKREVISAIRIIQEKRPPFQFLFGIHDTRFPRHSPPVTPGCQKDEWKDPTGNCRQLLCTGGKVLNENRCETALSMIQGLPYRMSLLLSSTRHHNGSRADNTVLGEQTEMAGITLKNEIKRQLLPSSQMLEIQIDKIWFGPVSIPGTVDHLVLPRFIRVNVFYVAQKNASARDEIENKLLDEYHIPILNVFATNDKNIAYQYEPFFISGSSDSPAKCEPCSYENETINVEKYKVVQKSDFIDVYPHLRCSYVKLSAGEVQETVNDMPVRHIAKLVIRFGHNLTVEITEPFEINQVYREENGMFYVCLELLESKFPSVTTEVAAPMNSLFDVIQHVLTGVCVSASLVCLLATVTTYCLFPSLRCVAGCNTLGLSASLAIAQILLLMGNFVPGPSVVCTVTGMITHYSWLVMFAWTFLCCLHMLRVFTSTHTHFKFRTRRSERKAIALNVAFALLAPVLIVVIVGVTHILMYDVSRIGYGYYSCGMDNVYTIHGPLIFVIVCNILFFGIVVFKIWGVRRLQQNEEFRKDFIVYIKLSSLTGMFWLLVILGEVFQNDVIRFLAIISNGCQGVFIFTSFVANRRVLKLYTEKFNISCFSSVETPTTNTGQSTTQTHRDGTT